MRQDLLLLLLLRGRGDLRKSIGFLTLPHFRIHNVNHPLAATPRQAALQQALGRPDLGRAPAVQRTTEYFERNDGPNGQWFTDNRDPDRRAMPGQDMGFYVGGDPGIEAHEAQHSVFSALENSAPHPRAGRWLRRVVAKRLVEAMPPDSREAAQRLAAVTHPEHGVTGVGATRIGLMGHEEMLANHHSYLTSPVMRADFNRKLGLRTAEQKWEFATKLKRGWRAAVAAGRALRPEHLPDINRSVALPEERWEGPNGEERSLPGREPGFPSPFSEPDPGKYAAWHQGRRDRGYLD